MTSPSFNAKRHGPALEALRSRYTKESIDEELAEITRMFEEYIKAR
jgi:hypothetical protein